MIKSLDDLCKEGRYLPPVMRDFHDQKSLFKALFVAYKKRFKEDDYIKDMNWVMAHVYTVDVFLWFMAHHGYTLQKARHNIEFEDLQETIDAGMKEWHGASAKILNSVMAAASAQGGENDGRNAL